VGGPACEFKKTWGIFSKRAPIDRYEVGLTQGPGESGPSAPDPTMGNVCKRPGGGGRAGAGGARRRGRQRGTKKGSRPQNRAWFEPKCSWDDGEANQGFGEMMCATARTPRPWGRTVNDRRAAGSTAARDTRGKRWGTSRSPHGDGLAKKWAAGML
jgi:hypothetical protein